MINVPFNFAIALHYCEGLVPKIIILLSTSTVPVTHIFLYWQLSASLLVDLLLFRLILDYSLANFTYLHSQICLLYWLISATYLLTLSNLLPNFS
jgi:hypothetical protein